jgi:hypothetical protein
MFLMATVCIFPTKARIKPHDRAGRFHQQIAEEPAALFADRAHPLLASRRGFSGNQTEIAGNVLASIKTFYVANDSTSAETELPKRARDWEPR